MKKKFPVLLLALSLSLSLIACSSNTAAKISERHWSDIYTFGRLSPEEMERREELKSLVSESLPPEMKDQDYSISIKPQRVEIKFSFSDALLTSAPYGWSETVNDIQEVSASLHAALQEDGGRSAVLYLSNANKIILTAKDGALLYDRFEGKKLEPLELETVIDPEDAIFEILEEVYAELDKVQAGLNEVSSNLLSSSVVYVSNYNVIHSIPNCSNMKNYQAMSAADAEAKGCTYCSNCW